MTVQALPPILDVPGEGLLVELEYDDVDLRLRAVVITNPNGVQVHLTLTIAGAAAIGRVTTADLRVGIPPGLRSRYQLVFKTNPRTSRTWLAFVEPSMRMNAGTGAG
ncbi:MAG: hypothetical protein V3U45_03040 [bacterium]